MPVVPERVVGEETDGRMERCQKEQQEEEASDEFQGGATTTKPCFIAGSPKRAVPPLSLPTLYYAPLLLLLESLQMVYVRCKVY